MSCGEKHFHNQAFDSLDALDDQLVAGYEALSRNLASSNPVQDEAEH